jgi:uncharacterized membrane protein
VAIALAFLLYMTLPVRHAPAAATGERPVPYSVVRGIVDLRCASCHSSRPTDDVFKTPPGGAMFESAESLRARAAAIKERTVTTKTMPLGNKTGMTDEEREILGRWIDQGARS